MYSMRMLYVIIIHILREVSASLLVQQRRAIPEPQAEERAKVWTLTLFVFINGHIMGPMTKKSYGYR